MKKIRDLKHQNLIRILKIDSLDMRYYILKKRQNNVKYNKWFKKN